MTPEETQTAILEQLTKLNGLVASLLYLQCATHIRICLVEPKTEQEIEDLVEKTVKDHFSMAKAFEDPKK